MDIPEYKSEVSVEASKMRVLSDKSILILKVYKPYRKGWDDVNKKFRSFYYFPARLTEDVVYSWDESAKIKDGDTFVLREKFWDDVAKKYAFKRITLEKGFNKLYKKVFDVDVAINKDTTLKVYDGGLKKEIDVTMGLGNTFTIKWVPSSRVIGMLEAYDLDADVPMIDGKDKLGNPTKVRAYDFEDALVSQLVGKFVKFKVRGEGIDTRYTFKEGESFDPTSMPETQKDEVTIDDVPF